MLVLQRKAQEEVILQLGGEVIRVIVLGCKGDYVKLGFDAPRTIRIDRKEIYEERAREKKD